MKEVNKFLTRKLANLSLERGSDAISLVNRALYLSHLGIDSDDSLRIFSQLRSHAKNLKINISDKDRARIARSTNSYEDALYSLVKEALNMRGIKKVAYPNPGLSSDSLYEEADMNKWLDTVHLIYKECKKGERSPQQIIEFYSNTLDKKERKNFSSWLNHHMSGESLKYSSKKEGTMKKESVFQSDLGQGNNPYAHDGSGFYFQNRNLGNNMPGDSFYAPQLKREDEAKDDMAIGVERAAPPIDGTDRDRKRKLKKDLHAACRRIDRIIREEGFCSQEEYLEIAKLLLELSSLVRSVKLASTIDDLTYRYARKIEKLGHKKYANRFLKLAQQTGPEAEPDAPPPPVPDGATEDVPMPQLDPASPDDGRAQEADSGPSKQEVESGVSVPEPDSVEPVKLKDITPIPGPSSDEYSILAGEISLEDAAVKLDEVAGMLADRRIIRQLAEFDIMLDKIGIASMFPELAESQSKLIDSFSYALTRVTKMMGQLSNAKSLLQAGGPRVPGVDEGSPPQGSSEEIPVEDSVETESPIG
jgi:hypothetical protein